MSFGRATLLRRFLAQTVTCLVLVAAPALAALDAAQSTVALRSVTVDEVDTAFVVTLSADGPI